MPTDTVEWETLNIPKNDIKETKTNGEDNSESPFLPSIFEQAKELIDDKESSETKLYASKTCDSNVSLTNEDTEAIFDLAFELPGIYTKSEVWKLTSNQKTQLGRIWTPVLNRLLPKINNMDLIVACFITGEIIAEKGLEYQHAKRATIINDNSRNEGARQDKPM